MAIAAAVSAYRDAVVAGDFPGPAESSSMDAELLDEVLGKGNLDRIDETSPSRSTTTSSDPARSAARRP